MKLLEEITAFPDDARRVLENEYGIETAEAFFAHVVNDRDGMQSALKRDKSELDELSRLVEGYLSADFIKRCHESPSRRARGVITD